MSLKPMKAGWCFFLVWTIATFFGVLVGFLVFFIGESFLGESSGPLANNSFVSVSLGLLIFVITFGLVTGIAQWFVLRRYVPRTAFWICATLLGFLISSPALLNTGGGFGPYIAPSASLIMTTAFGGALGIMQYLVIRKQANKPALWIGISLSSWVIAGVIGIALRIQSYQMGPIYYWLGVFFFGIVFTAVGMALWLKQPGVPPNLPTG